MRVLAVDVGGSHAVCALVEDRAVRSSRRLDLDRAQGLGAALPLLEGAFRELLEEAQLDSRACAGLAFSFCGLVDTDRNRILSTNQKYDDGPGLDLPGWCRRAFDVPLKLENDARMALLGERHAGAALGFDDVVMITLGTGIGGAAMIGGRLLHGKHYQAGCLGGHLPIRMGGRTCTCGNIGCVEAEAATWSLPQICREWPGFEASALAAESQLDFATLAAHARHGDRVACQVLDHSLRVWSTGAVALVHAYDPEVLVLGGGIMQSADMILPFIQQYVSQYAWTPWGKVQVRAAVLGNEAALVGAVPLIAGGAA